MPYQYIEAPDESPIVNKESVFLAGGITNCKNWQFTVSEELSSVDSLTVINPRRKNFEIFKGSAGATESARQIEWEYKKLRQVSQIAFWFTNDTVQPIALYELGATFERNSPYFNTPKGGQKVFLGVDPRYERLFDIQVQARLKGYSDNIADNLQYLIAMIKIYNKNMELFKGED